MIVKVKTDIENFLSWVEDQQKGCKQEDKTTIERWSEVKNLVIDEDDGELRVFNLRQLYRSLQRAYSEAVESQWCGIAHIYHLAIMHIKDTANPEHLASFESVAKEFYAKVKTEINTPRCHHITEKNLSDIAVNYASRLKYLDELDEQRGEPIHEAIVIRDSSLKHTSFTSMCS
jgi:hypothetical protein